MSDTSGLQVVSTPEQYAVAFSRVLRTLDISTPLDSVLTFMNALSLVGITDRNSVYWSARATLVRSPEDLPAFNKAFTVFWEHRESIDHMDEEQLQVTLALDTEEDGATEGEAEASDNPTITLRFSGVESLRDKDFAEYTSDEMRLAQQFMHTLRMAGTPRPSL